MRASPPLRLGGERRGEGTGQRGQQEAAAVHAGMVGQARVGVNVEAVELLQPEPAVRVLDRREDLDVLAALTA